MISLLIQTQTRKHISLIAPHLNSIQNVNVPPNFFASTSFRNFNSVFFHPKSDDDDFYTRIVDDNSAPSTTNTAPPVQSKPTDSKIPQPEDPKHPIEPQTEEEEDSSFVDSNEIVDLFAHLENTGDPVIEDLAKKPELEPPSWEDEHGSGQEDFDLVESVETNSKDGVRVFSFKEVREEIKSAKTRQLPEIREEDIEEKFIRGFGKGGQKVNTTHNCIQIKHRPSGIVVKCQKTRSQSTNRSIARKVLALKLDQLQFGIKSKLTQKQMKIRKQKEKKKRRQQQKKFLTTQKSDYINEEYRSDDEDSIKMEPELEPDSDFEPLMDDVFVPQGMGGGDGEKQP